MPQTFGTDAPYGADYNPVPPLKGPYAQHATYNSSNSPGAMFVLTNKATPEAQVAAIKLVDYMFTEDGQLRSSFGEEGKDWRRPQEGDVAINKDVDPIFATIPQLAWPAEGGVPRLSMPRKVDPKKAAKLADRGRGGQRASRHRGGVRRRIACADLAARAHDRDLLQTMLDVQPSIA